MKSDKLSLYQAKEITKKVYNNIMNSIKVYYKNMNTIFINSKNSKTSDPHRLLCNLTDKIDLRRKDKQIALSNLSIYYTWKNIKKPNKNNEFKISAPTWGDWSYSILDNEDYFEYILKKHGKKQLILQ